MHLRVMQPQLQKTWTMAQVISRWLTGKTDPGVTVQAAEFEV